MFEKIKDFYMDLLCFSCYRDIVASKAPREEWNGFIGNHIWFLSFHFFLYILMIFLIIWISFDITGSVLLRYTDPNNSPISKSTWSLIGVGIYFFIILFHYYIFKFNIGYENIISVIEYRGISIIAKHRYYYFLGFLFLLFFLVSIYLILKTDW